MKKILYSASAIAVVAALVAVGTGAFYGDTETSTGNTFTAGAIELKVEDRKSVVWGKRVELGGRCSIKKKRK